MNQLVKEIRAVEPDSFLVVLGDFNDYDGSKVMETLLAGTALVDVLAELPADQRYSYIFDGASQLIDWILVSPALTEFIFESAILHNNADFPFRMGKLGDSANLSYRSSDHDVPYLVLDFGPENEPARVRSTATPTSAPSRVVDIPMKQSPSDTPGSGPASPRQTETQLAEDSSNSTGTPAASKTVEAQGDAVPDVTRPSGVVAWIFALAAAAVVIGALAVRNRW